MILLATVLSTTAEAGGIGIITTAGTHEDRFYAYDLSDTQYRISAQRPDYGLGIQAVLGDRDDKWVGTARVWAQSDAAQSDAGINEKARAEGWKPTTDDGLDNELTYVFRDTPRTIGCAVAGVQWRLWGEPLGLQLSVVTNVGAGFLTLDSSEFLMTQVGPAAHYTLNDRIQVNAEVAYEMRYRKSFYHGSTVNFGVRYLID